jgi:hypothetical protein
MSGKKSNDYKNKQKALEDILDSHNIESDINYDPADVIKKNNKLNAEKDDKSDAFEFIDKYCKNVEGFYNEAFDYDDIVDELDEKMVIDNQKNEEKPDKPIFSKKKELMDVENKEERIIIQPTEYSNQSNMEDMKVEKTNKFKKVKKSDKKLDINNL